MTAGDDSSEDNDGRVLAPDELDIADDEHVAEIDEGRYVVSPNDPIDDTPNVAQSRTDQNPPSSPPREESESQTDTPEQADTSAESDPLPSRSGSGADPTDVSELSQRDIERWLKTSFQDVDSRYGFHVTATFDGRIFQRRMMSNDVVTIFESLILWYAQHIDSDTPVEEIIGILLTEANVPIKYPTESLSRAIKSRGFGPDDTIGDLIEDIGDDGFKL